MKSLSGFYGALLLLILVAVDDSKPGVSSAETTTRPSEAGRGTFVADNGQAVIAIYFKPVTLGAPASVTLVFPNSKRVQLFQARSGSGIRFTNSLSEWWEHQSEATYQVDGTNVFRGKKAVPDDRKSPLTR